MRKESSGEWYSYSLPKECLIFAEGVRAVEAHNWGLGGRWRGYP